MRSVSVRYETTSINSSVSSRPSFLITITTLGLSRQTNRCCCVLGCAKWKRPVPAALDSTWWQRQGLRHMSMNYCKVTPCALIIMAQLTLLCYHLPGEAASGWLNRCCCRPWNDICNNCSSAVIRPTGSCGSGSAQHAPVTNSREQLLPSVLNRNKLLF